MKEHNEKEISVFEKYLQIVHEIVDAIWRPLAKPTQGLHVGFVGKFLYGYFLFTRRNLPGE